MSLRRYGAFVAVGATAAAVHFGVAVTLAGLRHLAPVYSNVIGYLCALAVSFAGQSRLTFTAQQARGAEFAKFFVTSLTGFAANATMYGALLRWTSLDYRVALAIVLMGTAVLTYCLLGRWVFVRPRYREP